MTLAERVRSMTRRRSFRFLSTSILVVAGIWTTLPATEPTSALELRTGSIVWEVAGNQVGQGRDSTVDGDPRAGKALFEKHCVTCHGPRGRGDGIEIAGATVADLSSAKTQRKLNIELLTTIHEGRPGKVMPSWGWQLSEQESNDVLAYIRTLRKK